MPNEIKLKFDVKYYEYLDGLRESGVTNMFGARPYVQREFGVSSEEASAILSDWMKTFSQREESNEKA